MLYPAQRFRMSTSSYICATINSLGFGVIWVLASEDRRSDLQLANDARMKQKIKVTGTQTTQNNVNCKCFRSHASRRARYLQIFEVSPELIRRELSLVHHNVQRQRTHVKPCPRPRNLMGGSLAENEYLVPERERH